MQNPIIRSLIAAGLVFVVITPVFMQGGQSLAQLRTQIAEKEAVDRDPSVSPEVKSLNRRFLDEQRQQLAAAITKEIVNFQRYQAAISHTENEKKVIAETINSLQTELAELQRKLKPVGGSVREAVADSQQTSSQISAPIKTSFSNKPPPTAAPKIVSAPAERTATNNPASPVADCTYADVPPVLSADVEAVASDIVERNDSSRIGNIGPRSIFFTVTDALTKSGPVKLSALAAYTYIGETVRTDKQHGTTATAGGSTSAVEKPGWSDLLGFAIEHGAIQQEVGSTALTLSTTPYAFIVPSQDDTAAANRQYGYLKRLGFSASFNISDKNSPLLNVKRKNLSQYSARLNLLGQRGPNTREFDERWISVIKPAIQSYLNKLSGGIETLFGANTNFQDYRTLVINSAATDIQTYLSANDVTVMSDTAKKAAKAKVAGMILCALKAKVFDEVKSDGSGKIKIDKAAADHIVGTVLPSLIAARKQVGEAKDMFQQMLKDFERKPEASMSYTNNRPPTGTEYGAFNFLYQQYLGNTSIKMTFNAGPSFYHRPDPKLNQHTFRDFFSTISFEGRRESPFKTAAVDLSPMTYSLTARYQRFPENRGLPKKKADIAVVQFKLEMPISKGFTVPLSLTYANATEQIKERRIRGNFGVTFDLDKFLAVKKLLEFIQQ